jgi:hypothetical protein
VPAAAIAPTTECELVLQQGDWWTRARGSVTWCCHKGTGGHRPGQGVHATPQRTWGCTRSVTLLWATIGRCSTKKATRAKASHRDRQVSTTAWDGVAACRDADGGGVVPLRLSMTTHTTDEWRSSCVSPNMGGEGRGVGGGGRRAAVPANNLKWEGKGIGVRSGPRPPPAATVVCTWTFDEAAP